VHGVAGSQTLLYTSFCDAAKITFYIGRKKSPISISFIVIHLSGQCLRWGHSYSFSSFAILSEAMRWLMSCNDAFINLVFYLCLIVYSVYFIDTPVDNGWQNSSIHNLSLWLGAWVLCFLIDILSFCFYRNVSTCMHEKWRFLYTAEIFQEDHA